jgi:hypothetical protein
MPSVTEGAKLTMLQAVSQWIDAAVQGKNADQPPPSTPIDAPRPSIPGIEGSRAISTTPLPNALSGLQLQ